MMRSETISSPAHAGPLESGNAGHCNDLTSLQPGNVHPGNGFFNPLRHLFFAVFSRRSRGAHPSPRGLPGVPAGILAVMTLVLCGCAGGAGGSAAGAGDARAAEVIGLEDLRELERLNALQVVQRLRPQWLRTRGVDSFVTTNAVVVYVDDTRVGGVRELRRFLAQEVEEIRYLDSRQATTRFGVGHPSGAILLTTRRGLVPDGAQSWVTGGGS